LGREKGGELIREPTELGGSPKRKGFRLREKMTCDVVVRRVNLGIGQETPSTTPKRHPLRRLRREEGERISFENATAKNG